MPLVSLKVRIHLDKISQIDLKTALVGSWPVNLV